MHVKPISFHSYGFSTRLAPLLLQTLGFLRVLVVGETYKLPLTVNLV